MWCWDKGCSASVTDVLLFLFPSFHFNWKFLGGVSPCSWVVVLPNPRNIHGVGISLGAHRYGEAAAERCGVCFPQFPAYCVCFQANSFYSTCSVRGSLSEYNVLQPSTQEKESAQGNKDKHTFQRQQLTGNELTRAPQSLECTANIWELLGNKVEFIRILLESLELWRWSPDSCRISCDGSLWAGRERCPMSLCRHGQFGKLDSNFLAVVTSWEWLLQIVSSMLWYMS